MDSSSEPSSILSPNTRQRKSRMAKEVTELVKSFNIATSDEIDVLKLSLEQLNILEAIQFTRKPTKRGRKLLSLACREQVWNYWHQHSFESTNCTQLAKLRVNQKPHIQEGLDFASSVITIRQRNRSFYQSIYEVVELPYKSLYLKFLRDNPDNMVSWGTFFALKPFYVRHTMLKNIEMCCCRQHLHARWVIDAFLQCAKKHDISFAFHNYKPFFTYLYSDCPHQERTYISWECTSDSKSICHHVKEKWDAVKDQILALDKETVELIKVPFLHFEKTEVISKKGVSSKKLKPIKTNASISFLFDFIDKFLTKFIHHRNMLRHYH